MEHKGSTASPALMEELTAKLEIKKNSNVIIIIADNTRYITRCLRLLVIKDLQSALLTKISAEIKKEGRRGSGYSYKIEGFDYVGYG